MKLRLLTTSLAVTSAFLMILSNAYEVIEGDIRNEDFVKEVAFGKDVIIHLAAYLWFRSRVCCCTRGEFCC